MNWLDDKRELLRRLQEAAGLASASLSTRLMAAMVALVLMTATAVGVLTYRNVEVLVLPRVLDRIDTSTRLLASELGASVRGARADAIAFRSAVAIEGMVRAALAGGVDPRGGLSMSEWRDRLAQRFVAELEVKPNYLQFRVIGVADSGRELLRVERVLAGAIRIVPQDDLQPKGDRDYFRQALAVPAGGVYISNVDLNREHGRIEVSHIPILRVAAPIHAPDGTPFGIVVINVELSTAFEVIRWRSRNESRLFVVNEAGDYLAHPDRTREFGFEFGKPQRLQDDFPELAEALTRGEMTPRVVQNASGESFGAAMSAVRLAGGPRISIVEVLPYGQVVIAASGVRNASLLAGLLTVLCALGLAVVLARSLTRPLVQMTQAVRAFGRGEAMAMPVNTGSEVGLLASAFGRMAADVRDQAMALRREAEERGRLFDASPDLILVTDLQGNVHRASPSSAEILGYQPSELVGRSALQFIHPSDLESARDEMSASRRGRITRNFETRYYHKDGHAVMLAWSGAWSEAEQRHYFIGRDISAQRLAEEKFRLAVEGSPSGMVMIDAAGLIVLVNAETERLFGYTHAELVGQPVDMLVPPDSRERHADLRGGFTARPSARRMGAGRELNGMRKDGTQFPVEIGLNPIQTPTGLLVLAVVVDVTAAREVREALVQSERMAHEIIDTALDALVQMDGAGRIVEWNPQAQAIFGWSRAQAAGQQLGALIVPPERRRHHDIGLARFLRTGKSSILGRRLEVEALRRDGSRVQVELTVTALRRRDGYVFNGFIRDLTERVRLEEQVRHSQKMEAVGQLTGGIAHDFNNLLTVILGNLELLDRKLADDTSRSLSREAREAAEMGARLTDRLLTIARQRRLEPRRISLNDLVLNLADFLRRTIGAGVGLSTVLSPDLWPTVADPGQVESAVLNLAINARDAMPKGGKLCIETMNVTLDADAVLSAPDLLAGDYVMLSVSDTGHGMSPEVKARAFEPFFTTKQMQKGNGLGLATIYGFARQSGGNVTIYSEIGQGTTVKLYLPRAADGPTDEAAAPLEDVEHMGQGESVLVVEDDDNVRRLTVTRLEDLGYRVLDVADAHAALAVLGAGSGIDLVFSDLVMPGSLSGLDLARRVKLLYPRTRVILTSGYSAALMHDDAIDQLELAVLRKPYRQAELARVFRTVLDAPLA